MNKTVKGYKAMKADMTCRGFKFTVGETYKTDKVSMCSAGFHFCENPFDVYNHYEKSSDTVVCEVEASGETQKEGDKSATTVLKIVKKLTDKELLDLWIKRTNSGDYNSGNYNSGYRNSGDYNSGNYNSGDYNSGYRNSGHRNSGNYNSGHYNSGDYNSGYRNSGDYNSGNYNSGYRNSGDYNSGYRNSGHRNSGNYNSGHYNSGDYNSGYRNSGDYNSGNYNSGYRNSGDYNSGNYNSGDYNSGFFNTKTAKVSLFDKECDLVWDDPKLIRLNSLTVKPILQWIEESQMTEQEKTDHPSSKTRGGFLKNTGRLDWSGLTSEDKALIQSLPGFDAETFKTISGIDLDTVEVTINGKIKVISKAKAIEMGLLE